MIFFSVRFVSGSKSSVFDFVYPGSMSVCVSVCVRVCVGNKLLITSITQLTTEDRMDEGERGNHDYYALLHHGVCFVSQSQKISTKGCHGIITRRKFRKRT